MATEEVFENGQRFLTLKELLRPGLKAVFVGLNPSRVSVEKGHYHQGRLGQRFWKRLRDSNIAPKLPVGIEDDVADANYNYGFADLVRRPTNSAGELSKKEKQSGVSSLLGRLSVLGDRPIIIFIYEEARKLAGPCLKATGYRVYRMPGMYATRDQVDREMKRLKNALRRKRKAASD